MPLNRDRPRLRESVRILQTVLSPKARNRTWMNQVTGVIADLKKLNQSTESGFVSVGSKLMAFLSSSRQLHSDIASLTAMVSGQQARQACDALVSVRGYVQEVGRTSENGGQALLALQASAASIHRGFSTLGKIAMSFHVTAMVARIETARLALSQQDLGSLADEVRSCSAGIQARADQVLDAAVAFHTRIASTLREVSRLGEIQQKELPALLAAVNQDLERFETRQSEAASASSKLAADLDAVTRDLGAIATSIQFHDITRQQVEHVIDALAVLLRDAPKRAISPSGAALVQLQKAQLRSASASFVRSAQTIDRDLEGIAHRVEAMATASAAVLGSDPQRLDPLKKDTFLSDIHARFAEVLRAIGQLSAVEQSTRAIVCELKELNLRLRASVKEVLAIELQLARISVNAALSASHMGSPGEPLGVVAAAMQALQQECAMRSRAAEADLDAIGKAIHFLATGGAPEAEPAPDAESAGSAAIVDHLNARMADLQSACTASNRAASAVIVLARALGRKLQEARDHSRVGPLFAETVDRCCDALDRGSAHPQAGWFFSEPALEHSLEERYTMQAEREIHNAAANGQAGEIPAEASEECGEVEFF